MRHEVPSDEAIRTCHQHTYLIVHLGQVLGRQVLDRQVLDRQVLDRKILECDVSESDFIWSAGRASAFATGLLPNPVLWKSNATERIPGLKKLKQGER
jgi:hypothetical protein